MCASLAEKARAMRRALAAAAASLLLAGRLPAAGGQQPFTTALTGLGGTPIGASPIGAEGTSTLDLYSLSDIDPDAVCNDGSPAGYYYAAGSGTGAKQWLVYLEGSMFCWDGGSCHDRYQTRPYFMSSESWASKMAQGGIFDSDADKSGFGNSNRVYVKYCSSDLWMGDVAASDATFGFAFRGQRIANAVVAALVQKHGMSSGARLLFGGCSAGAIGAMLNLDVIADSCAALGIEVRGLLDAAALVDVYPTGWPWSPDLTPLQTLMAQLVALLRPPLPEACVRAGLAGDATWKCFFSAYRMPLLATPFFANAVQFDDFELQYDTDNLGPSTPAQFAFVNSFQPAFLDLIAALPPGTGVYSPTCLVHCLSGQPTFADFLTNGVSMSAALSDWYFGDQPTSVVSPCQGFSCTSACGVNVHGLPCNLDGAGDSCQPVTLPTSEPNEPAPATSDAPLQLPSEVAVQDSEQSLTTDQQSQLSAVLMQQGPSGSPPGGFQLRLSAGGRKMLETKAALITCCGN